MLYNLKNPHGGDIYGDKILLDYSANTNPFGTPQGVVNAVIESLQGISRYPDPYCRKLMTALSVYEGVPEAYLLCGNGAAELIYSFCRAVSPRTAVETAPTFSEYSLGAELCGCKMIRYSLKEENDFQLTEDFLDFLEIRKPDAVFLCNPNNPTGQLISPALLDAVLNLTKNHHIRLLLDECFLDLTDSRESLNSRLSENPQLVILKCFTKSYGMAGLRLGYCISSDRTLLQQMSRETQPWNVSVPAQAAGVAALNEQKFLEQTRNLIREQRKYLSEALRAQGLRVFPSQVNFILWKGPVGLDKMLRQQGIAIRSCANYYGLEEGWYRIAVRLPEENQALIGAIRQVLERM